MAPTVDILLATYNGEAFLAEQIESLLAQSFTDWRLLVRDDGSSDETTAIIGRYVSQYPGKIHQIEDQDTGLGAAGNFARLIDRSRAPYAMLCDQDDVWLPHKIERMLSVSKAFLIWSSWFPVINAKGRGKCLQWRRTLSTQSF